MFVLKFFLNFLFCLLILSFPIDQERSVFHLIDNVIKPHKSEIYKFISFQVEKATDGTKKLFSNTLPHQDKVKAKYSSARSKSQKMMKKKATKHEVAEPKHEHYSAEEEAMLQKILSEYHQ